MGSGIAKNIPAELQVEKEDVDEMIDVDTLYTALFKLCAQKSKTVCSNTGFGEQ